MDVQRIEDIFTCILVIGGYKLTSKIASKFTGTVDEKIYEKTAEIVLEKLTRADAKLAEMNQEEFTKFMYSIIMETKEYSNKEAKKILSETEHEIAAVLETISGSIKRLSIIVDSSLQDLLSSVEDELALQTLDLKDDLGELFVQQRKHEKKFMTKFDIGVQRLLPAIKATAKITRGLDIGRTEKTRQEVKENAIKLDILLTHFGITPDVGTEPVVNKNKISTLKQAIQIFEKTSLDDLSYLDPEMLIKTGLAYRELGEHSEANRYYRASIQIKDSSRAFFHLGYSLYKFGENKKALVCWEKAHTIQPEDSDTLINWGNTLHDLGRFKDAIQKYQQADHIHPVDATTLMNWGITLTKSGRFKDAIQKYQQADHIRPGDATTLMNWGITLDHSGRFEDAIQKYQQADHIRPGDATTLMDWGITLTKSGRFEDAIQKYQQANHIRPGDATTLMNWGITLTKSGRFEDAIQKYQQANRIRPEDITTLGNWGIVLAKLKHFKEAQKMYQQAATTARAAGDISRATKYEKWLYDLKKDHHNH